MDSVARKQIEFSKLCELIDLYKRASIDGDRVDLIVSTIEEDKRTITIRLQKSNSISPCFYLYENGKEFDEIIYPKLANYFLLDDYYSNWIITDSSDDSQEGVMETNSGNVLYLKTNNKELFSSISEKLERKKGRLTTDDKIWDEIIQYVRNRNSLKESSLTEEESSIIYKYLMEECIDDEKIKYGNTKEIITSNEKYLMEVFKDRDNLIKKGFSNDLLDKINSSLIKQMAQLLGSEKRIRYRLDIDDNNVKEKIDFVSFELAGVGYFDLKNSIARETPTIKCKMGIVSRLLNQINHGKLYTEELANEYRELCYEIVGYLYRKGMQKDITKEYDYALFEEYYKNDKEKNTSELTKEEIEEIIESIEKSKNSQIDKKDLFTVVKQSKEKNESSDSLEIEDAYEKSLDYSTELSPSRIKILFEGENDDEADVIISNNSLKQDLVIYRRPISIKKLQEEVMDILRRLFAKNNSIHYNIKYKVDDSNNSCLLLVGDKRTTFTIINAPDEFVNYNKKKLEELMG